MALRRDDWLDVARKVNWNFEYVEEKEVFPEVVAGAPWLPQDKWTGWNEVYRNSYREYVENQMAKDDSVQAVRDILGKQKDMDKLDPKWLQLIKFSNGATMGAEHEGMIAELRMARFGRDSAWRTMATLGSLDEMRHEQIQLIVGHDMLRFDGGFNWTHKGYHTNEWGMIAAKHLMEDMCAAANVIDTAIMLTFVFETGFTNLQFVAMAAMAEGADDKLFEKALTSIQTDESRHAQQGHPVLRTLLENGYKEYAQFLLDKQWWRSWRIFHTLTGTSMDYLTPLPARQHSFKEFMEEWIIDQFLKNLEEFGLDKPWFWDIFIEELDHAQHMFQLGLYTYRNTLWFDEVIPSPEEKDWLREKYPNWQDDYGHIWEMIEKNWRETGKMKTLPYSVPALCNLCQLPCAVISPTKLTARSYQHGERKYIFCSEPCEWIFKEQPHLFAEHQSVVDRIFTGDAPTDINAVIKWFGLTFPEEIGTDVYDGEFPWPAPAAAGV